MNSNFANNLKKLRKDNNLSQEELALELGVSRQSVSKWESGQTYPEMDKVLQLCKMFNVNIDELLSQNIKEVKENIEAKNKLNKYVDDFLAFLHKTIAMFANISFKCKVKCIIEQLLIFLFLYVVGDTILIVGGSIVGSIFNSIPFNVYKVILGVFRAIYIFIYFVLAIIVYIDIFKTRYLDYYKIDDNYEKSNDIEESIIKEEKNEKIIIRDPKHSDYRFINGLFKCLLFFIKFIALTILFAFSLTLLVFAFLLVVFIYYISINNVFIGLSTSMVGIILINIIVLISLYSFIFNKKYNAKKSFIVFIISILIAGVGLSITFLSSLNLEYNDVAYKNTDEIIKTYDKNVDIYLNDTNVNRYEIDNTLKDNIKVKINYNKDAYKIEFDNSMDTVIVNYYTKLNDFYSVFNEVKKSLKDNKVFNYRSETPVITIITSEDNIKNIIKNKTKYAITNLYKENNIYSLEIIKEYSNNRICYLEDNYYNNCIEVYKSDNNINVRYDKNGIHYDNNVTCMKDGLKYYYCKLKNN